MRRLLPGLRGKLALAIAAILLIALGATFLAVYRGTGSELRDRIDSDLELELDRLSSRLAATGSASPAALTERARLLVEGETFGPDARLIAISVVGGGMATNQPELIDLEDPSGGSADFDPGSFRPGTGDGGDPRRDGGRDRDDRFDSHDHEDDHGDHRIEHRRREVRHFFGSEPGFSDVYIEEAGQVRLLTGELGLPGGNQVTIRIGTPLAPVENALEDLSDTFLIVALLALLCGAAVAWFLASRVTRPMRRMAAIAEGVNGGDLSARMPIDGTRDEARRLAESFNGMLDRLEDAFERQRTFVADASHDLRTPLTVVRGQIEVLARNPDPDLGEIRRVAGLVSQAVARMQGMVEDLLLLARAEAAEGMRLEESELGPLIEAEIESFTVTTGRDLRVGEVTAVAVNIEREQLSRAVSNLIANAVGNTGPESRIEVSAVSEGGAVILRVDDDGPGVPEADRERIFDRFVRLDEARSGEAGGAGLGLAIVRAVALAHHGSVRCLSSPLGGARFELELPAAG